MSRGDLPIGVLGSGLGGLSLLRVLRRILPFETFIYLGDTAGGPYGNKSPAAIERCALAGGAALARHQPKLLVLACSTLSAYGLGALQAVAPCPVLGAIEPAAKAAAAVAGPVGLVGTAATIASGAFQAAILRGNPEAVVHAVSTPLLEGLAEEGWLDDAITDAICRRYLNQIPFEAHTVVLGCTHYPVLLPSLTRTRPNTRWLDCAELTAQAVEQLLRGSVGFRTATAQGELQVLLTDLSPRFQAVGERFLGEPLGTVAATEL